MTAEAPLPCPFCGGAPRMDLAKKTYCQLHGEPAQAGSRTGRSYRTVEPSSRHRRGLTMRPAPYGYTSWRAYWIEMAIVIPSMLIGFAAIAVASLI
jgi:hypothetical protein